MLWSCTERAWRDALEAWARAQELKDRLAQARPSRQDLLTRSPLARLYAQAATMPVIEQAKGVLMAQQGCGADEAFDLLRRASQRSNVPVRVLAEHIVTNAQRRDTSNSPTTRPRTPQMRARRR